MNKIKELKTWVANALKATPLNANNLTPLILMAFLALELVFLFVPNEWSRAINIIVSLQYMLVFYAGYKAKPEDKELFYPFALYFLYVTGMYISGIGRELPPPSALDYIVFLITCAYFGFLFFKRINKQ